MTMTAHRGPVHDAGHYSADEWVFLRGLGKRVRILRLTAELSQEQLAHRAGMSRNFVSSIERGGHGVDVVRLLRLARALEIGLDGLLPPIEPAACDEQPARRLA